jgi:hypothetical protein
MQLACNTCGREMAPYDYWHMSHAWRCVYRLKRSPLPLEASPSPDGSTFQTMGCAGGEKQAEKAKE